jgi:glycosyltransferase involved in cell wall biosynthesis
MKILFFTESLTSGGKERRILELIKYLRQHTDYEISLVITEDIIDYDYVYQLGIPLIIIKRERLKYDPQPFVKFYRYCREFKPDIIHAWGRMTTFYAIPTKLIRRIPLISSMIADAKRDYKIFSFDYLFFASNIIFSNIILANSKAGLTAHKVKSHKAKVIWNGVHLERFIQKYDVKKVKEDLNVTTDFMLVMVAAFSLLKDYDLFLDVAKGIGKIRNDVTLVGVGFGSEWERIQQRIKDEHITNVILIGKRKDVESIMAASDIGILCTYAEGISNSIIECMALGKPVISTDIVGGSKEIIVEGETGYCIERNAEKIVTSIDFLLKNSELRTMMGNKAKERISSYFSIKRMSEEFESIYEDVLAHNSPALIEPGSNSGM